MKGLLKFQVGIILLAFLFQISWSKEVSTVCPKLSESLCSDIQTKSSNDTVYASFFLQLPYAPRPDSCKVIDLKEHPTSACDYTMDSTFWTKLKQETEEVYAKYSSKMMDIKHPSQSLPYPGDSSGVFRGAILSKADLLLIVQDSNIVVAETYFFSRPDILSYQKIATRPGNLSEKWMSISVNGRMIPKAARAKSYTLRAKR